jgi:hypothetical protein
MPNNTKHLMLKEAKRIANIKFKDTTEEEEIEENKVITIHINSTMHREMAIEKVLDLFEFDENEFRKMIRTFELRNKELVEISND